MEKQGLLKMLIREKSTSRSNTRYDAGPAGVYNQAMEFGDKNKVYQEMVAAQANSINTGMAAKLAYNNMKHVPDQIL